jgi:hypothetical protein
MRLSSLISPAAVIAKLAAASPLDLAERATPTLYLAGDSTMAKLTSPTDGSSILCFKSLESLTRTVCLTCMNRLGSIYQQIC